MGRMALLNDPIAIAEARSRLEKHAAGTQILPADLRSACYKTVLRAGGKQEFDTLLKLYRSSDLHEEKDRYFYYITIIIVLLESFSDYHEDKKKNLSLQNQ